MFQLRFVLLAALIPLAGIAAIFGGTGALHTSVMPPYEAVAGASAAAASGAVAEFASATVDAAAHAASDADVQQAISKGQLNPKAEATLLAIAGAYGAPSFALLVNVNGAVIARSGAESRLPDDLGGLPVVAEALTGVSRDGLWIDNGLPVHLAASAVYEGTTPNGGVVLGWAFTPALVAQLARDAGAPTVIVAGQTVVGALPEGVEPEAVAMREGRSTRAMRYFTSSRSPIGTPPSSASPRSRVQSCSVRWCSSCLSSASSSARCARWNVRSS